MKPSDIGMPVKFSVWRPHQLDAVISSVCSDKRFTILNMPPGTGKSPAYIALWRMLGGRMLVLTSTKALQSQLMTDFKVLGMREMKGQSNYPCQYFAEDDPYGKLPGCDEGPCHAGIECDFRYRGCDYFDAMRKASLASVVVENYSHWMTLQRYSDPLSLNKFDILVLDEAHDAATTLADFVRIHLDRREVTSLIGLSVPYNTEISQWVEWAEEAFKLAIDRLETAKDHTSLQRHSIKLVKRLSNLAGNLSALSQAKTWRRTDTPDPPAWMPGTSTDWIIEDDGPGITFQPTWASGYAEEWLFAGIKRVVLVSATITPKDAGYVGIPPHDMLFKEYPSPFAKERRPLIIMPTVSVRRDLSRGEEKQWLNRIDAIIDREPGVKGVIHTVSYRLAELIGRESRHRGRFYLHVRMNARSVIEDFKRSSSDGILVSPVVTTGYDFPYGECRFQIIAKMPFIDNRPAIIKARHKADKRYLDHVCLVTLMQMVGRGMRAEDDWCRTYLIDSNWGWFYSRNRDLMPRWFKTAVRRITTLPELDSYLRSAPGRPSAI